MTRQFEKEDKMKNSEIKTLVEIGKDLLSLNSKYGQMLCSLTAGESGLQSPKQPN